MNVPEKTSASCLLLGPAFLSKKSRVRLAPALARELERLILEENCRAFRLCDGGSFSQLAGFTVLNLKEKYPEVCLFFDLPSSPVRKVPRRYHSNLAALSALLASCDYFHFLAPVPYLGMKKAAVCYSIHPCDLCLSYDGFSFFYPRRRFARDACAFSDVPLLRLPRPPKA